MLKTIIMITVTSLVIVTICYEVTLAEEQDEVGIYFDQEGLTTSYQTTQPWEWVYAWLILKNIRAESGIQGIAMLGAYEGTVANFCWMSLIGGNVPWCYPDWLLGAEPPVLWSDVIPVVHIWFQVLSPQEIVLLYILPYYPIPPFDGEDAVYQANDGTPGTIIPLYPSSGSYDLPVAAVNAEVVAYKGVTWGGVKALYR